MKRQVSSIVLLAILSLFICTVSAAQWSALDREIFALNDQVVLDLGEKTSFYDWLEITPKATPEEIHKAYKKLSRRIHPDKIARGGTKKAYKAATERFTRLGLINKILRETDSKERYDFFLKHGFPKLRGSEYFYSRYRPGIGFVVIFLFLLIGTGQYVIQKITARQHRNHMQMVIDEAKSAAWPNGFPDAGKKKVSSPNGKTFMVYPDGKVCLVENMKEYPLDLSEIKEPHWKDTILYTLPMKLFNHVFPAKPAGRVLGTKESEEKIEQGAVAEDSSTEDKPKVKAKQAVKGPGGRRRK